ncbi:MAG: Hsp20/alpha crystallin family protein [bacterium]
MDKKNWYPLSEQLDKIGDIVDNTMHKVFREELPTRWDKLFGGEGYLACDLIDKEDHLLLRAEVPGLKKENLEISASEDSVTIKGERKQASEEKGENYYRVERKFGTFLRTIGLPVEIKPDMIDATLKDGILEIKMPKKEIKKSKKVQIIVK